MLLNSVFETEYLLIYLYTTPFPEKFWRLWNALTSRICYLLILFNLYLINYSTKQNFVCFHLTNIIKFFIYKQMLVLMAAHSKKASTEACVSSTFLIIAMLVVWKLRILIVKVLQAKSLSNLAWFKTSDAQQSVSVVVWFSFSWWAIHFQ